ncbi:hypothetical protein Tco_0393036 [Tanacetum coccineum]
MSLFINWFCKRIRKKKLSKADLEGSTFKVVRPFHDNIISLQFQMEECHLLLTDQVDLVNPKGHQVVLDMSKPLPLGGPPGQVTIQTQYFFNKDLEYLVSGDKGRRSALSISKLKAAQYLDFRLKLVPSLWIESECEYDISASYEISHWWFKRKEFYITRHSAPSDSSTVRSHMWILSVVSLKTYERYRYNFLKEIVLRRADYKEYKISEADFKNLHPNDFEDLYLRHLQGQLNHLSGADKVHLFNAVNLWIRNSIIRNEWKIYYTIVSKPRAVIYRDRNDQKKMMQETEVHKFSDGTLNRILDKLDHMVKDFKLFKYNLGMETRIWSENDRRRSNEFIENIRVIPKYHGEDGNPVRANIKQALGRFIIKMEMVSSCSGRDNFQDQERYEHVGPQDTRPQDGERSQDDDQRLDLADDLKKAQDHISKFAQILDIPCEGACVFTEKLSLDELAYGVPMDGPYQTNPLYPDDIISYIRNDREGQVTHTRHRQTIGVQDYQILTREILSTLTPLEEIIRENVFCLGERKTRKDHGIRRGLHSTSSSSTFDQPSSSHLNNDDNDDDDENDEGTSRASTPSLTRFVNSLTNEVNRERTPELVEKHEEVSN